MKRRWSDARLDRAIERELVEGLPPRQRARLHERLRRDPRARARYDRAVEALRGLEGDADFASFELDVVGRWLESDWGAEGTTHAAAEGRRASRWWPALLAAVAAALVLLWVVPLTDPHALRPLSESDGWQVRGPGGLDGLALEALCGPDEADAAARRVRARDCQLSELMGLAYRMPASARGQLSVFGIDAQGDVMFYLPTPVDPAGAEVRPGRWRALPLAVRLSVNHAPGALRIYGLVAPRVATVDEVRAVAEQLAPQPAAAPGDEPWTARVAPQTLAGLCPEPSACQAAELVLTIRPQR